MKDVSVDVVIPFHNGSAWIERALMSATNQSPKPKKVLVVDDGSAVEEASFLHGLASTYNFEILTQRNAGQSRARNLGVQSSDSDYICFLDQDDYFLPNHISALLEIVDFSDAKFAFSYGDLVRVSDSGEVLSESCVNVNSEHPHTDLRVMVRHNMYILPSATLIKRTAFLQVGGFDEKLQGYEDDDLFLRFFLAGYSSSFTPKPVSAWTVNLSSTSFTESMSRSRFLYFNNLLELFPASLYPGFFGDLLVPRFAYKIAEDVIESALAGNPHLQERVGRLRFFRNLIRHSPEIGLSKRVQYLTATSPLVFLSPSPMRSLLRLILKLGPALSLFRIQLLDEFLERHSNSKKLVG